MKDTMNRLIHDKLKAENQPGLREHIHPCDVTPMGEHDLVHRGEPTGTLPVSTGRGGNYMALSVDGIELTRADVGLDIDPGDNGCPTKPVNESAIDNAVNSYVNDAKVKEEENKSLYTEQGAASALYKQVAEASNMMTQASVELTERMIEEQIEMIEKVVADEKAKGELADKDAIAQAEGILESVSKFKDDAYKRLYALTESSKVAPLLYDYILKQTEDKSKLIRYRAIIQDRTIVKSAEDFCKLFKLPVPLKGDSAIVGIETLIHAAVSNMMNEPKKNECEGIHTFVFSEKLSEDRRGLVLSKAIKFVIKFITEHGKHYLSKLPVDARLNYQFLIVDDAVTAIEYDEALRPVNNPTPLTEDFTKFIAKLLNVYFSDIKVTSLK